MKWLDSALDLGISEADFWEMSVAELLRAVSSKKRQLKQQAQERASADYILADLIGRSVARIYSSSATIPSISRSVARIYSSSATIPSISEAYPTLFDTEAMEEQMATKRDELSALRFKQFAQSFNANFKGGSKSK